MAFIVDRYGEYVLLKPNTTGSNLLLWIAGPLMLLIALGGSAIYLRRRSVGAAPEGLSEDERSRLSELMKDA
jgi:cytochrome c-type biogenesis protein CcmH